MLLVDCDPQGSLATLAVSETKPTLAEVLTEQAPASAAVRETAIERLAILPTDQSLVSAQDELFGRPGWYLALRHSLASLTGYDVLLVDTPPGLGVLSLLALNASNAALVVCPPEFLAYRALGRTLATIERARQMTPELRVLGILPTQVAGRSRHQRAVLKQMEEERGSLLLPPLLRRTVIQDAARAGLPVVAYAPRSDAAASFIALANSIRDGTAPT